MVGWGMVPRLSARRIPLRLPLRLLRVATALRSSCGEVPLICLKSFASSATALRSSCGEVLFIYFKNSASSAAALRSSCGEVLLIYFKSSASSAMSCQVHSKPFSSAVRTAPCPSAKIVIFSSLRSFCPIICSQNAFLSVLKQSFFLKLLHISAENLTFASANLSHKVKSDL